MKFSGTKYTLLTISITFLVMFTIPMLCGIFLPYQSLEGYLSPIILLLFTAWLYRKESLTLDALGLPLKKRNIRYLPSGLLIGILFATTLLVLQAWSNDLSIHLNKHADIWLVLSGSMMLLQGVLNEELIFRGYCFKKTIEVTGMVKANLLFALLFLVWHWIALDAWGNWSFMLGLITTCFGHFLFSTSLLRSGTLYLPIGIHWGNNWAGHHLFATGMTGPMEKSTDALFYVSGAPKQLSAIYILGNYSITIGCMLACTWLVWKYAGQPKALS